MGERNRKKRIRGDGAMERYEPFGFDNRTERKDCRNVFPIQQPCMQFWIMPCFGTIIKAAFPGHRGAERAGGIGLTYLRELRVFDEEQELLLVPSSSNWIENETGYRTI